MDVENDTAMSDNLLLNAPELPWCFDIMVYYKSLAEDDEQARNVLEQLETYSKFSFIINGITTCLLAIFGLLGNLLFVYQIHKSRFFSKRLAFHLSMLSFYDGVLIVCCLLTYGITSLFHGIIPIVGRTAYLLYFFQPFASLCVLGGIWQVLAITIERYTAVSKPLEQRTRTGKFSVRAICSGIFMGAFLLNMFVVPFERKFIDCYEFTQDGFETNTMLTQEEIVNNQYYAILVHLIPDIIFRAPTPIIIIAILTVRTILLYSKRSVGSQIIQTRRNVPYMLTLLNIKFILCNTLYLFNTILMEVLGYGGKTSSQQTELEMEQYIRSLYLTDFSNLLLAIHSATNWLIFYHWPRIGNHKKYSTLTISNSSTSSKTISIDQNAAELLLSKFSAQKYKISTDILLALCNDSPSMAAQIMGKEILSPDEKPVELSRAAQIERQQKQQAELHKHAITLANIIEEVLFSLTSKGFSIMEWRELCRTIGYKYHTINMYCNVEQWKLVRDVLVASMSSGSKWHGSKVHNQIGVVNLQKTMLKCGALCGMVDISNQQIRSARNQDGSFKNGLGRMGSIMSTAVVASSTLANQPRKESSKNGTIRSTLKTADSFGNESFDSTLDSPTIHANSGFLSRFNFLINSKTNSKSEAPIKEPQ
ncbi:G-PROTEIN-RECEP-F1-2 domain-containing protein [Aphelenchoides bicaudatus]|nr:G-PROTEIN-RECEP-F1-2 domain-containing protein [Aphelenchoides bicaudatus]